MNCEEIQESLSLYCDDGLADDERTRCDRHLEVCPVCRDELAQFRAVRVSLGKGSTLDDVNAFLAALEATSARLQRLTAMTV